MCNPLFSPKPYFEAEAMTQSFQGGREIQLWYLMHLLDLPFFNIKVLKLLTFLKVRFDGESNICMKY